MIDLKIRDKDRWKEFILREAHYPIPADCRGGLCVDAGCNIGDFVLNNKDRFDSYVCFDVFEENVKEAKANTKDLGLDVKVVWMAVWDNDDDFVDVMAYEPAHSTDLNHFGNSGNVGCIEGRGVAGEGWSKDNLLYKIPGCSLEKIIHLYGDINLLKVDVEGSEYRFLLGKDLSRVNWITMELHGELKKQDELCVWIGRTHELFAERDNVKTWKRK